MIPPIVLLLIDTVTPALAFAAAAVPAALVPMKFPATVFPLSGPECDPGEEAIDDEALDRALTRRDVETYPWITCASVNSIEFDNG